MLTFQQDGEGILRAFLDGDVIATEDEAWYIYRGYQICEEKMKKPKATSMLHRTIENPLKKEIKTPWQSI